MRSKDRLAELRSRAGPAVYEDTTVPAPAGRHDEDLRKIFAEVERVRGWISEVEATTDLVARLHADPTFHNDKELQQQVDGAAARATALGLRVCGALRELSAGAGAAGAGAGGALGGRVRRLQAAAARRRYGAALARHHEALDAVRRGHARLLHEQIRITNQTITDEECENLLETNNVSIFVDNVAAQTAEARLALRAAEARHGALRRAEAALADVRDLFAQVASLVALQQEQLDTAELQAAAAGALVGGGQREILRGAVYARKSRKKKIGLIICLVSGFLVVLFVLVAT